MAHSRSWTPAQQRAYDQQLYKSNQWAARPWDPSLQPPLWDEGERAAIEVANERMSRPEQWTPAFDISEYFNPADIAGGLRTAAGAVGRDALTAMQYMNPESADQVDPFEGAPSAVGSAIDAGKYVIQHPLQAMQAIGQSVLPEEWGGPKRGGAINLGGLLMGGAGIAKHVPKLARAASGLQQYSHDLFTQPIRTRNTWSGPVPSRAGGRPLHMGPPSDQPPWGERFGAQGKPLDPMMKKTSDPSRPVKDRPMSARDKAKYAEIDVYWRSWEDYVPHYDDDGRYITHWTPREKGVQYPLQQSGHFRDKPENPPLPYTPTWSAQGGPKSNPFEPAGPLNMGMTDTLKDWFDKKPSPPRKYPDRFKDLKGKIPKKKKTTRGPND